MPLPIVEKYFTEMAEIRATQAGVSETSYYPALANFLNEIGKGLSPKVTAIIHLRNKGAGIPDGGLFTSEQLRRSKSSKTQDEQDPFLSQLPARGVIEIKPPSDKIDTIVESEQIQKYFDRYGLVLVTNYREFALVGRNSSSQPAILETFSIAKTEADFWKLISHPHESAKKHGGRLEEYLRRVMIHNAPLSSAEDLASIMASYARDAKFRIEHSEVAALSGLRKALEDALGLHFEGEKGDHFFRSTLVQTLFYGVFSAWVLWAKQKMKGEKEKKSFKKKIHESHDSYDADSKNFDWHMAQWILRVPMIRGLFGQVANPAQLGALGITEVLDWTSSALNRVEINSFFSSFDESNAVQYFYEPFLKSFDPELRKDLGVWYTPEEIVEYQVERIDAALRTELNIPDGLADSRVVVLDPCCGTGTYLRAVLKRVHKTLFEKGGDALVAQDLKKASMERVFGFEILPAPFVIAHLQIGLLLEHLGAPLTDSKSERVGIYLTNALTGWEPPKEPKSLLPFPELQEEHDAAEKVKREAKILVILGNPPYNAFAGISPEEENDLVEPYKGVYFTKRERKKVQKGKSTELKPDRHYLLSDPVEKGGWGIKKFNLDDLYVRFFRIAEKRIAETGGIGVVSFISNHSWISDPSYVILRKHLLDSFDAFWIENMHGNRKISEYAPDGRTSETIFSVPGFSEGIQQGVAISLWVKRKSKNVEPIVRFRDDLNAAKAIERREQLLKSLECTDFDSQYTIAKPGKENRWSFRPANVAAHYLGWPKIPDLCAIPPCNGPIERRGNSLIVFPDQLNRLEILSEYLNPEKTDEEIIRLVPEFMTSSGEFDSIKTRKNLKGKVSFDPDKVSIYPFKPFDKRIAYLDASIAPLFSRPSPQLLAQNFDGNRFFITRDCADKDPEGTPFMLSQYVCDYDCVSGHARHFPLLLKKIEENKDDTSLPGMEHVDRITANLSVFARKYLSTLGFPDPDEDKATAELIWMHALAMGYSPAYLKENVDGIKQDWPRIPLPKSKEVLLKSAELGRKIAELLDTENPVTGITAGRICEDIRNVAVFSRVDSQAVHPEDGDLDITAGWGHGGKDGVTMPGKGKFVDNGDSLDIYLNDVTCWKNIPKEVWDYTIGGYQVIKKWLSYREKKLLGRGLTIEEVRYVTEMSRRIHSIILLQTELDANYHSVIKETY